MSYYSTYAYEYNYRAYTSRSIGLPMLNVFSMEYIRDNFIHMDYLRKVFKDEMFTCDKCPFCKNNLVKKSEYYFVCKYDCYQRAYYGYDEGFRKEKFVSNIKVFNHHFRFGSYYETQHRIGNYFESPFAKGPEIFFQLEKLLRWTIKYYQENNRYLIKFLLRGD